MTGGFVRPGNVLFLCMIKNSNYDGDGGYTGNQGKKKQAA
jgi:hypothetical protein